MRKIAFVVYGVLSYALFAIVFSYAIGFVGDVLVPKSIDTPAGSFSFQSVLLDALLLLAFAIQHSVMARSMFKKWWTRLIPKPIERSTYVLFSSLILAFVFWAWQPMTESVWKVESGAGKIVLGSIEGIGWIILLLSTFMISHFDLFGLRQVILNLRGREYIETGFRAPLLYRIIRHPMMLGVVIAFWVTPSMTLGHLLFAILSTGYILVGIQLEERDLIRMFGNVYLNYRRRVPMLIPVPHPGLPDHSTSTSGTESKATSDRSHG